MTETGEDLAKSCGLADHASLVRIREGDLRFKVTNGTKCNQVLRNRTAEVILVCSENTELGTPMFIDEFQHCEYLFLWITCAACPLGSSYRDGELTG